jgi:hypothetical protein
MSADLAAFGVVDWRFWLVPASGAMIPISSRSCEMPIGDAGAQVSS